MRIVKKVSVLAVGSLLFLTGCSMTKPSDNMVADQTQSQMTQRVACEQRKAEEAKAKAEVMANLSEGAQMLSVALENQYKVISAATGHKVDDCNVGSTYNDALITEVKEKNQTVREVLPDVVRSTVYGGVAYKGLETINTAIKNSGNHTSTVNSGDGASSTHESTQVTSNNDQAVQTDGDSSPASAVAPPVTGPSVTTTEMVAEPEPLVVEE